MKSLRERLADPHGYDKPLFPRAIESMNCEEWEVEATECTHALLVGIWQATAQFEEVQARQKALHAAIRNAEQWVSSQPEPLFPNTELTRFAGFNMLKR